MIFKNTRFSEKWQKKITDSRKKIERKIEFLEISKKKRKFSKR